MFDRIGYNFIEGKGLLIVIVVLVSSVSFILGFFAGKKVSSPVVLQAKNTEPAIAETRPVIKPAPPQQHVQTDAAAPKPLEEVPAAKKTYEILNTAEQPDPVKPHTPQQPKPEQAKPEPPKLQPKLEPAELPKTPIPAQPKAKTSKHTAEANPQTETKTPMPAAETTKPTPAVKDVLTPVTPPPQTAQSTLQASKTTAKQQKTEKEAPAANSGDKYFIQIGAFRNFSDAMKLQEDLKAKGFDANIVKVAVNDGVTLYKVRLGGNYAKTEASQVMTSLNKKGIKGFIKESQR
ncbi:MAG: SPOR domain-containing protein [Nitrospirota bacterium]